MWCLMQYPDISPPTDISIFPLLSDIQNIGSDNCHKSSFSLSNALLHQSNFYLDKDCFSSITRVGQSQGLS